MARNVSIPTPALTAMDHDAPYQAGDFSGDRYPIIRTIGDGGMAVVYEVYDLDTEQPRAMKVIRLRHQTNRKILDKMLAEAKSGMEFVHPNLVRVFDVGSDGAKLYMVMELLRGRTLEERLRESGQMQLREALQLGAHIAGAMHMINQAGIVHRDLKPENIFLTDDGGVKILDLGAAKFLKANPFTTEGKPMGTPLYMSPEHLDGQRVDARTDVFAIGHILYQCIAGHHELVSDPNQPPTMQEVIIWQHGRKPRPLTAVVPGLPDPVWKVVARALEKDRNERYPNNGELEVALVGTLRWLEARGLFPPERASRPHDSGDPARSIVHVARPGERLPSNLPYVNTREESPSLRNPDGAQLRVEHAPGHGRPTPVPVHAKGVHGTQIIDEPASPIARASSGAPAPVAPAAPPVASAPAVWGPPPPSVAPAPIPATRGTDPGRHMARHEAHPRAPAIPAPAIPEPGDELAPEVEGMPLWLAIMLVASAISCVAIAVYFNWIK